MALDGPSTCPLTSPSSFRPSRAARAPAAGWAEVGPQAHWSVAGTLARGNGSGRAVAAYRGRIFIERPRIAAVQAAISRHAPEGRPPPSLSLARRRPARSVSPPPTKTTRSRAPAPQARPQPQRHGLAAASASYMGRRRQVVPDQGQTVAGAAPTHAGRVRP